MRPDTAAKFSKIFNRIFVVTNQRGIARGLMTVNDLKLVNDFMLQGIEQSGGRIDKVYFCPHDRGQNCGCRKPDIGMALQARHEFPEVDFSKSIMVGDSTSDMEFGQKAGMVTVKITENHSLSNFAATLQ